MDTYTKSVLTVIAGALVVIALESATSKLPEAAPPSPVLGDLEFARQIDDPEVRKRALQDIDERTPVVYVVSGHVAVHTP